MKEMAVLLGRFSPFYKGHQSQTEVMINERGMENCLVMIGSSESYNFRTPFTYEQRRDIIKVLYPEMKIVPLPDIKSELIYFDGSTNRQWLAVIKNMEKEMGVKFVFYGGCQEDLSVLSQVFETRIAESRYEEPLAMSATEVRKALDNHDMGKLEQFLDARTIPLIIEYYNTFLKSQSNSVVDEDRVKAS